jgi:transaldolase
MRGIERRLDAGLDPSVGSVASVFVSRWDAAVTGKVPDTLRGKLGIAIAERTYKAARQLLGSPRWQRAYNAGARPQRPSLGKYRHQRPQGVRRDVRQALAAPFTVNTMPEATLMALADHGELGTIMGADGGDCEEVLAQFAKAGINVDALAAQLQEEGAKSFVKSWNDLMSVIASKSAVLQEAA